MGCGAWKTSTDPANGNMTFTAAPCDASGEIELLLIKSLTHTWPTTTEDVKKYGIDTTDVVWDWINRQWGS